MADMKGVSELLAVDCPNSMLMISDGSVTMHMTSKMPIIPRIVTRYLRGKDT